MRLNSLLSFFNLFLWHLLFRCFAYKRTEDYKISLRKYLLLMLLGYCALKLHENSVHNVLIIIYNFFSICESDINLFEIDNVDVFIAYISQMYITRYIHDKILRNKSDIYCLTVIFIFIIAYYFYYRIVCIVLYFYYCTHIAEKCKVLCYFLLSKEMLVYLCI